VRLSHDIESSDRVLWSLRALGGEATLGDLIAVTGLSRGSVERSLDTLIAADRGHVRVREPGDLTYHLGRPGRYPGGPTDPVARRRAWTPSELVGARRAAFDRKTLRLIRARCGVLSLAELVEQTGLPLRAAEAEMRRLAESWGGEPHPGLDGHVVYAFPALMESVHGRFAVREPRPAWVRAEDPMDHAREGRRRARRGVAAVAAGGATLLCGLSLLLTSMAGLGTSMPGLGSGVAVVGGALLAMGIRDVLRHHPRYRFRQRDTLRRYALGYVVETALAGKGVVSLERTVRFIQGRAGKRTVHRATVEAALRDLAVDFGAPITTEGGDLFFGFRSVKRQFLASHLVRRQLALGRTVCGETVFDTGDAPEAAWDREMDALDRGVGSAAGPGQGRAPSSDPVMEPPLRSHPLPGSA
jgi:hypothetical protein